MVLDFKAVNRSTSKHWSDRSPQKEHCTLLHQEECSAAGTIAESKQSCSEKSRLFSVLEPQRWNELPTNVRTAESIMPDTFLKDHICQVDVFKVKDMEDIAQYFGVEFLKLGTNDEQKKKLMS